MFFSFLKEIVWPDYIALKFWQTPNITEELFVNDLHSKLNILYEFEGECSHTILVSSLLLVCCRTNLLYSEGGRKRTYYDLKGQCHEIFDFWFFS